MESTSNKVFSQYGEVADSKGIEAIPEPERTLVAVYTAQGIIGNGGFAYFFESDFEGDNSYEVILKSYRNIGLDKHASSLENILALFPDGKPHSDKKERESFIYKHMSGDDLEHYSPDVESAETVFFENPDEVYKLADEYVEQRNNGAI